MSLVEAGAASFMIPYDLPTGAGYLIGALPLFLLPVLYFGVRETARFTAVAMTLRQTLAHQVSEAKRLFEPRYLPRVNIVLLLWNCVYLVIAATGSLLGDLRPGGRARPFGGGGRGDVGLYRWRLRPFAALGAADRPT